VNTPVHVYVCLVSATDSDETLHSCSLSPEDVHEGG